MSNMLFNCSQIQNGYINNRLKHKTHLGVIKIKQD